MEEKENMSVQEMLKKYDSNHLLKLAEAIEFEIEAVVVKIWGFYTPEQMTKALQNYEPILELEYMINQASYLAAIENELKERNLLEAYRNNKAYIDFEKQSLVIYKTYEQRFQHLIYLKLKGFLEAEHVRNTILKLRCEEAKKKDLELDDDPIPNILA